jgi:hypothetical protein
LYSSFEPSEYGVTPVHDIGTPGGLPTPGTPGIAMPTPMEIVTPTVKPPRGPTPIQIDERLIIASKYVQMANTTSSVYPEIFVKGYQTSPVGC